jgi:hypothetical protein
LITAKNAVWLTRKLNTIKTDLVAAGLEIDETKSNEHIIWIKKDPATDNKKVSDEQESPR